MDAYPKRRVLLDEQVDEKGRAFIYIFLPSSPLTPNRLKVNYVNGPKSFYIRLSIDLTGVGLPSFINWRK